MHYNIAQKREVNPFEKVNYVTLNSLSTGVDKLNKLLSDRSLTVETRKINGSFHILYDIKHLDFTTIMKWFGPERGTFQVNNHSVHFRIEEDIMHCW